jgi:hypothetical protein
MDEEGEEGDRGECCEEDEGDEPAVFEEPGFVLGEVLEELAYIAHETGMTIGRAQ